MLRRSLLLAAALLTWPGAAPTPAQDAPPIPDPVAALLAVAADLDRDGAVTAAERDTLVASVPDTGGLAVLAALLMPVFDRDRDGAVTVADLRGAFAALDADGDGSVGPAERMPPRAGAVSRTYDALLVRAADADGGGTTSAAEWQAWLAAVPVPVDVAVLSGWIRVGSAPEDADRTAFTPSVFVMTLDSRLDVDGDGRRTRGDLRVALERLDADGDGVVTAAEFANPTALARTARTARQRGWPTPSADDRARPPLVPWQRSLDDALALVAASGKPLLVCVNIDGEPASDSIAWVLYRDPEWVELMRGFVPVLASPDARQPRTHDDRGRRLPDPRFGRLVQDEHIAIEPALYERYFDGRRVAPRHVGVAPDGAILFDVFLATSSEPIEAALRQHGRRDLALPQVAVDDVDGLLASPDAAHRDLLEARFGDGDAELRRRLASLALAVDRPARHPTLLRMGLADPEPTVRHAAAATLAALGGTGELDLFVIARRVVADAPELRAALVDGLHRIARSSEGPDRDRAARLARLAGALEVGSLRIDADAWIETARTGGGADPTPTPGAGSADEQAELDAALDGAAERRAAASGVEAARIDAERARLELRYGEVLIAAGQDPRFVLMDAARHAAAAVAGGLEGVERGRALATAALADWLLNETAAATAAALAALPLLGADAGTTLAARLLAAFADLRTRDLYAALDQNHDWPPAWLADVLAARTVLFAHPAATEADLSAALDWLDVVGAWSEEAAAVRAALERFPVSPALHERFRGQLLRDGGATAVARGYATLAVRPQDRAAVEWYRGVARAAAAERHVANREPEAADGEYAAAVDALLDAIDAEPGFADSANHYIALAFAGRARLALDRGESERAAEFALDALRIRPESAESADGLGHTPLATATAVRDALPDAAVAGFESRLAELGVELRRRPRRR